MGMLNERIWRLPTAQRALLVPTGISIETAIDLNRHVGKYLSEIRINLTRPGLVCLQAVGVRNTWRGRITCIAFCAFDTQLHAPDATAAALIGNSAQF